MKINFQHIIKTAFVLSVILLTGIINNGNQNENYFFSDDETSSDLTPIIENDLADFTSFDLEKETDEKEKFATPFVSTCFWVESLAALNCPAPHNYHLPRQTHILISSIDLPPPGLL